MKFSVKSNTLLKALENVQGVVDRKSTLPILANVRISTNEGKLVINAANLDMDIVELVDAQISEEGSTTVSAFMLFETIKRLPSQSAIEIHYQDDILKITCGTFHSSLNCLPVKDFPSIYVDSLPIATVLTTEDFKKLIEKTKNSVAMDNSRAHLGGIYIHTTKNNNGIKVLRAVTTDSHRLSLAEVPCDNALNIDGVILPKKTADELDKLLGKTEDKEIKLELSDTRASFSLSKLVLTSKLIDGTYPNYQAVIPTSNNKVVEIHRTDFLNAIDLISTYSDIHKSLTLNLSGNKVTLSANAIGNVAQQTLNLDSEIEDMIICFNAKYIQEICNLIKTEKVVLSFGDSNAPALLKKQGEDDEIFVVMPMKIAKSTV